MSIKVSDLGIQVSDKIKNVIFPNDFLIDGDFVTPLIPLMTDPKLAPEVGAVISKINSLKESIKDAEIEALKQSLDDNDDDDPSKITRRSKNFFSEISQTIDNLLSLVLKDDHLLNMTKWKDIPEFGLSTRLLGQDNNGYFLKSPKGEDLFYGKLSPIKDGYSGVCDKINRKAFERMMAGQWDHWIWQMEKSYSFLYLLKLALDQLFVTDSFEFTYTPSKDSKLKKYQMTKTGKMAGNISNEDDWLWLTGKKEDSCLGKPKTAKWSVDTEKLESLFSDILDNYQFTESITNIETKKVSQDLKPLIAIIDKLLKASIVNNGTIETLVNSKPKKPPIMKGATQYKCSKFEGDIVLAKTKTERKKSDNTETNANDKASKSRLTA